MNITSNQYRYLKSQAADLNDIKVSLDHFRLKEEGVVYLRMRDHEFVSFESARRFIINDARSIEHGELEVL